MNNFQAEHPIQMLALREVLAAKRIFLRGIHHYNKIGEIERNIKEDTYLFYDLCFHTRSLSEVSVGMMTWFESENKLENFSHETLDDLLNLSDKLLRYFSKAENISDTDISKESAISELSRILKNLMSDKKEISYRDGRKEFRNDDLYKNTTIWTSKYIHADEYSISFQPADNTGIQDLMLKMGRFWQKDFHAQVYFALQKYPDVLKAEKINFPFDIKVQPFD